MVPFSSHHNLACLAAASCCALAILQTTAVYRVPPTADFRLLQPHPCCHFRRQALAPSLPSSTRALLIFLVRRSCFALIQREKRRGGWMRGVRKDAMAGGDDEAAAPPKTRGSSAVRRARAEGREGLRRRQRARARTATGQFAVRAPMYPHSLASRLLISNPYTPRISPLLDRTVDRTPASSIGTANRVRFPFARQPQQLTMGGERRGIERVTGIERQRGEGPHMCVTAALGRRALEAQAARCCCRLLLLPLLPPVSRCRCRHCACAPIESRSAAF